jgi:hypothetical protein
VPIERAVVDERLESGAGRVELIESLQDGGEMFRTGVDVGREELADGFGERCRGGRDEHAWKAVSKDGTLKMRFGKGGMVFEQTSGEVCVVGTIGLGRA